MNNARFAEAERAVTGVARRVLDVVPFQEPWTFTAINAELTRTGSRIEHRIMLGCLNSLKDSGLVREPAPGAFVRIAPKPEPLRAVPSVEPAPTLEPASSIDWVARLTDTADNLAKLSITFAAASSELTAIAIGVEAALKSNQQGTEKIEALRALLKGL